MAKSAPTAAAPARVFPMSAAAASSSCAVCAPAVSVIVLTYNCRDLIGDCLQSVLAQQAANPSFEVIVVDNASTDGTADRVEKEFSHAIRLIRSQNNGGYAAGNNLGAQSASGQSLVFLNPDTVVPQGWLAPLIEMLRQQPDAGAVCSKVMYFDRPNRVNAIGVFMSQLGFSGSLGDGQPAPLYSAPLPVFAPTGCSFAISAARFREIGGFDESFFLYEEDVDLGWRLHNRGWGSWCAPHSEVMHKYHAPGTKSLFYFYATRNRGWTIRKNLKGLAELHLLGHYAIFSIALAAMLALTLRFSASFSVLRGLRAGLRAPIQQDPYASSIRPHLTGVGETLSIAMQKLQKHFF